MLPLMFVAERGQDLVIILIIKTSKAETKKKIPICKSVVIVI